MLKQIDRQFLSLRIERVVIFSAFAIAQSLEAFEQVFGNYASGIMIDFTGLGLDLLVLGLFSLYLWKYSAWLPTYILSAGCVLLAVPDLIQSLQTYYHLAGTTLESDTMRNVYILLASGTMAVASAFGMLATLVLAIVRESREFNLNDDELMGQYERHVISHFRAETKRSADDWYERIVIDFYLIQLRDPELNIMLPMLSHEDPAVRFMSARQLIGTKEEALPVLEETAKREDVLGQLAANCLDMYRKEELKFWIKNT